MSRLSTKARRSGQRRHRNERGYALDAKSPGGHYDQQGREIGLGTWAVLFEDRTYRFIRETHLRNGYHVSTIWLGLDHGIVTPRPVIFESMVFGPARGGRLGASLAQDRYCTRAEAVAGHKALVEEWSKRPQLDVLQGREQEG